MRTAIQLRSGGAVGCELVCGEPESIASGALGPVAVFAPHEVVGYLLRTGITRSLFVFRTLAVDDRFAAWVPGVRPGVRLLVHVRSALRVRALRRLLNYIATRGISASHLSDDFFVRVSFALGGRTDQARLRALLRREPAAAQLRAAAPERRP